MYEGWIRTWVVCYWKRPLFPLRWFLLALLRTSVWWQKPQIMFCNKERKLVFDMIETWIESIKFNFLSKFELSKSTFIFLLMGKVNNPFAKAIRWWYPMWPDWVIYCTLGNFSKPVVTIILPKLPTFLGIFVKVSKSLIFLVKSFLGNFYRNLVTFYWSHWWCLKMCNSASTNNE